MKMNIPCYQLSIKKEDLVFQPNIGLWCSLPYPEHPQGCPNYNKGEFCPPKAPIYTLDSFMKYESIELIYVIFPLKEYVQAMQKEHPLWTNKQLHNVLYWQGNAKKQIKDKIERLKKPDLILGSGSGFNCPSMEAVGINVIKTLQNLKIEIEVKPLNKVILCALIGYLKKKDLLSWVKIT
jgi:predicted metal-binding protein